MEDRIDIWRNEWLASHRKTVPTWSELANRIGTSNVSEQNFWRTPSSRIGLWSDQQMIARGLLIPVGKNKIFHAAYIPWDLGNGKGKKTWELRQWEELGQFISQKSSENPYEFEHFNWRDLCLRSQDFNPFARVGTRNCHIIGDFELGSFGPKNLSENFFDGNVSGVTGHVKDCQISGAIWVATDLKISGSRVGRISYNGSSAIGPLEVEDSEIEIFHGVTNIRDLRILNSDIGMALFKSCEIFNFICNSEKGNSINLNLEESTAKHRITFSGYKLVNSSKIDITEKDDFSKPFEHTKFEQKLRIFDCDFRISDFANAQFDSQVDIEYSDRNIEDVFEREIASILQGKARWPQESEIRRQRLERACQILCERHRQDGRKDLEHRFRRMEIKARSFRSGAEWDTRIVSWVYSTFSDFGRSFARPIFGLFGVMFSFSIFYWIAGAFALDLNYLAGQIDWNAFGDAFLLGIDKTFPFGASIDEAKLFEGRLVGENAGAYAFVIGLVGAVQTIISGVMVFFAGLAVRTKLLIG